MGWGGDAGGRVRSEFVVCGGGLGGAGREVGGRVREGGKRVGEGSGRAWVVVGLGGVG